MSFGHVFPKQHLYRLKPLSLGVYDAVCSFNDGNVSKFKMLQKMGVEPGEFSVSAMKLLDRERLMKAIYAFSGRSKKIRKDKRRKRKKEEDNIKKNKVKTGYSAGSFDEIRNNLSRNNDAYRCPVIEHVTGPAVPNSSTEYGPRIKDAENPHQTVTFGCEYSPNRPQESVLRLFEGYSKAILDQLRNEQETAVRTDVESRNHVEAIPAQVEACMDSNEGCFA
ncbi:hypothetical protein TNCV_1534171 [Trichonephila clavipes]|nr:hypothetical protein TNCV_1534171 [Trichonephila clavipes]